MLMCVCVSVCASIINPNDWQCPPHFLLLFLPLLTLLSATCHWDFLMSSIARLYLDGQSLPPLMYLMAYLRYCSWQGGEVYVCLYISLFKRAKHPRRVERWERLVLLLTSRAYIPNSVWLWVLEKGFQHHKNSLLTVIHQSGITKKYHQRFAHF